MNQEKIGKFISKCRKDLKMTQTELAEKLGVSDKTISNWENARCMPDLSIYKPLCDVLDITINELMSGEKINEENYQEKLEENMLRINLKGLKKNVLSGVKLFLFLIILVPFLALAFILGYTIIQEYRYGHIAVPSSEVNLKMCETEKMIWLNISRKNEEPVSFDDEPNLESRTLILKTFRYRSNKVYEGYAKDVNVGYKKSKYDKFYYDGKLVWDKTMKLEKCE